MLYKLMPEVTAGLAMLAIFMVAADAAPIKKALAKPQLKRATPLLDTTPVPGSRPASHQVYKLGQPLTGGISVDVPRTPETVAKYLARMKKIIQDYNRVALAALSRGNSKDPSLDSLGEVTGHTVYMIRHIRAIVPPAEMKAEHNDLANTLYYFGQLAENPNSVLGSGLEGFTKLYPMLGRLSATLTNYHRGVNRVIASYKLSPSLDPFGDEDEDAKRRLSGTIDSMTGNLSSGKSAPCDDCAGSLQQMLGGMGGLGALGGLGGGGDMGSLGNMDLGSLSGQLGNIDMSQLNKLMGELGGTPGGSSTDSGMSDSTNNLNQLLEQLQGQH
ncbi:MAG: hypothetical protein K2X29_11390 [Candidatus Obscuribacterales bacterium]|nr:hypothetical protein [Candidatus Obscuribacterales bacterium]